MKNDRTVGVVIPIYNVQDYLKECLDSVINQTYKNLQVVLVNDGSTDENSLNIAKEYTLKDERFILFDRKNQGLPSARNLGIEYFSKEYELKNITSDIKENSLIEFSIEGNNEIYKVYKSSKFFKNENELLNFQTPNIDYIIFLDSDDYWELNCIEECVLRMDGVEVVWFNWKEIYEDDILYNPFFKSSIEEYQYKENQKVSVEDFFKNILKIGFKGLWFGWQGMVDFNFLKNIKLKFIDQMTYIEDFPFGILLFAQCNNIYILTEKLYYYRIRKGSNMNHKNESENTLYRRKSHHFLAAFIILDYLEKTNLKHKNLLKQTLIKAIEYLRFEVVRFSKENRQEKIYLCFKKLFDFSNDVNSNIKFISELIDDNINFFCKYGTAKQRIQNQLSYKLGQTMIMRSASFSKILSMPFYLISTFLNHKLQQKIYQKKIEKNPSLKLPRLKSYPDYQEALKEKESFTYKLGKALIKANNDWYRGGYIKLWFEIRRIKKELKINKV
ncbi:glycosyltransferase family 2 protein [Campylobacter molothri]|uniref:glycosyltransferase family 2 protein n=1 Tax=Campylobacter molothri TaxID=1032242 RepID=UPI0035ADE8AE